LAQNPGPPSLNGPGGSNSGERRPKEPLPGSKLTWLRRISGIFFPKESFKPLLDFSRTCFTIFWPDPVKNFFPERREKIAKSLQEIEARFQKAKETQKSAEQKLKESKKIAEEIMKDVELEIEVLKKRFDEILPTKI